MILLVGASASGKTEIAKILTEDYGIGKVITFTTREKRPGEINGKDYHFVDVNTFLKMQKDGQFVETTCFNGHYYGSAKSEIGENKVLIVDPSGLASYLALKDPRIVSFYLETSEPLRKKRMQARGDKEEAIASRLENDRKAFAPSLGEKTDFRLQNETASLQELAKQIYELYLRKRKAQTLRRG